ncbi:MAG TPA: TlyA family RNA methyltransferase [Candidatus Dormibacteraeota bacterium]|nr:TlyA family RNA methyltransferase [Candidatus Dormibacteraeota bacterium]
MRLDVAVAEQLGTTRARARSLIIAGRVRVDGRPITKPGTMAAPSAQIEVREAPRFVSRGGEKLAHALGAFAIDARGLRCLDVGASTGGFTDCLLQAGAARVVALDVGYGQMAWSLRNDPRVEVIERTNFRTVDLDRLGEPFDLVTIDASFISLLLLLERARDVLKPGGRIVGLIKPQFEAGPQRLGSGGVVRDPAVHEAILREVRDGAAARGVRLAAVEPSPLRGPAGNVEFLGLFEPQAGTQLDDGHLARAVARAHAAPPHEGGDT